MPSSGTPSTEAIEAFKKTFGENQDGRTINYGAKIACFVASKVGETDLPGIET
jgi:hypothetical protein